MKEIGIDHNSHASLSGKIHSELRKLILNGELKAERDCPRNPTLLMSLELAEIH